MTRTRSHRWLPVGYAVIAGLLAALLLPTVLRPPQDQQSTSTAFSPDAPPDDAPPETLLAALRRASSSTAGSAVSTEAHPATEEVAIPPPRRRAARGRCFGDPPRQTESLYSALCVPAWTGSDNGGATAPGVYRDEIRIGITVSEGSSVPEGRLERDIQSEDSDDERHLKIWQAYFNDRFELYGRYLQFYVLLQSYVQQDQQRASVRMAKSWDVFAIVGGGSPYGQGAAAMAEAVRLGIIDFGSVGPDCSFYINGHPYAFSFQMDACKMHALLAELACKQFGGGRPPGDLNNKQDPTFDYNAPRKWGLIVYTDETRTGGRRSFQDLMARCGITFQDGGVAEYNLTDNQSTIAGIMTKMRAAGVTTILMFVDFASPIAMTYEAERSSYYPEYIQIGLETNSVARGMSQNQAAHMAGLLTGEIPRHDEDKDWFRAYKEIDPDGSPGSAGYFRSLQQLSGGIQHAGPKLTAPTFWQGLLKQPYRAPDPVWSIGGGYGEGDYTYQDYVSVNWWDRTGSDPSGSGGAWCNVEFGRRFKPGEMPTERFAWLDKTKCITRPPDGVQG